jgi:hypothetical protein
VTGSYPMTRSFIAGDDSSGSAVRVLTTHLCPIKFSQASKGFSIFTFYLHRRQIVVYKLHIHAPILFILSA